MKTLSPSKPCADACTASTRPAKARPLPFPELPKKGAGVAFWLPAWARETAKYEALMAFSRTRTTKNACDKKEVLYLAMLGSEINLRQAANQSFEMLKDAGGLLFAFAETSKLAGAAA